MSRIVKDKIWNLLNIAGVGGHVELFLNGQLKENGWFRSFKTKQSVDKRGNPIPWNTYSYIKFIEPRLKKNFDLFEYGSGNSSMWYAERVNSVRSVENHKGWYEKVSQKLPANASVVYKELKYGGEYSKEVTKENKPYHVVIIDGRDRNNCAREAVNNLTEDGVIIFDNSDREDYNDGVHFLLSSGFRKIDFWGMSPVTSHLNCTSVFYRPNNCLNI